MFSMYVCTMHQADMSTNALVQSIKRNSFWVLLMKPTVGAYLLTFQAVLKLRESKIVFVWSR